MTKAAAGSGLRSSAFFFGHAALHLIDNLVQPAIFLSMYYTLVLPEIRFVDYYIGQQRFWHAAAHRSALFGPCDSCILQYSHLRDWCKRCGHPDSSWGPAMQRLLCAEMH